MSNFPDWKSLAGTTLDGGYELKEIIEAEQGTATLQVRVLGDYTLKALARFYVVGKAAAQEQVSIWQGIHWLERKGNLNAPLSAGRLLLNGLTIAYLVFQVPDEALADVIRSRALQPDEAMEVLRSAAQGLSELHAAGFVHGGIEPEEILAFGDSIRCSTEGVRRINTPSSISTKAARYLAPESGIQNVTVASDIWCLGATLFETVARKKFEPGLFEEAENLQHPFGALATCCLDPDPAKRCKLADLDRISKSKPPAPKPKPAAVPVPDEAQTAPQQQVIIKAAAAGSSASLSAPERVIVVPQTNGAGSTSAKVEALAASAPALPLPNPSTKSVSGVLAPAAFGPAHAAGGAPLSGRKQDPAYRETARLWAEGGHGGEEDERAPGRRGWVYALAGFAFIFLLLWFFRSNSHRATSTVGSAPPASSATAPPPQTPAVANPSAQKTAWPTKTLTPAVTADTRHAAYSAKPASGANATSAPANAAADGQPRTIWRVILYTYNRQQDANAKAQVIDAKRPDLHAAVFTPNGNGAPYLVVAGGQMTRPDAARLKLRALHEGMPRDSYLQNFSK